MSHRDGLSIYLASQGKSPIQSFDPISNGSRYINYRVELLDGQVGMLRVAHSEDGEEGLAREAAALHRLLASEVPLARPYRILPHDVCGAPASWSLFIEGSSGWGVMDSHAGLVPDLCHITGQVMALLATDGAGPYGSVVTRGRFAPVRTNWSLEYYAMLADWAATSVASRADLGPLLRQILSRYQATMQAMSEATAFCVVHGDLRPSNLLLTLQPGPNKDALPTFDLTGVVDWEFAIAGDELMAFALPLELTVEALAHVVDGYGREKVTAMLDDPSARLRLEAYTIGRVVQFLAVVAAPHSNDPIRLSRSLAYAYGLATERLDSKFVETKLRAALELDLADDWPEPPEPDERTPLLFQGLWRLSGRRTLQEDEAVGWLGAMASALLDGDEPAVGWSVDSVRHFESLRPTAHRSFEPISNRPGWVVGFENRMRVLGHPRARLFVWLAFAAMRSLTGRADPDHWPVPDSVLRGLQATAEIEALQPMSNEPRAILFDLVLGLAAETAFATMLGRPVDEAGQSERRARLAEAWEDVTLFQGITPTAVAESELRDQEDKSWKVPVLLYAVRTLGDLPMPKPQLIGVICG